MIQAHRDVVARYAVYDIRYTIAPKIIAYSDEVKELAIKTYYSGVSGRGVGKI